MSEGLPMIPLSEVLEPISRPIVPVSGKVYRQLGVQLWGKGAYEREPLEGSNTRYATLSEVKADDVVVNKIWARNGSIAVVNQLLDGCYVSGEFPTFLPDKDRVDPQWIHWLTKTPGFWSQCDEKSQGTSGKNRIKPENFLKVEIPLPLLDEQRRIVGRIGKLTALVNDVKKTQHEVLAQEASLLQAFRNKLYTQSEESSSSNTVLFEEIIDFAQNGLMKRIGTDGTPTFVLKLADIRDGRIVPTSPRKIPLSEEELEKYSLNSGDLLIIRVNGSKSLAGRAILFNLPSNWAFCDHLIRIRLKSDIVSSDYVRHYFDTDEARRQIESYIVSTAGQNTISQNSLKNISIPLPAPNVQKSIVKRLEGFSSYLTSLVTVQNEKLIELDALIPSILDKAFKGEL